MKKCQWTFLTNHGHVFAYVSKCPRSTTSEIAREVCITQRAVQKIIADLEMEGYITRYKEGRTNRYTIHPELPLRHPLENEHAVGDLLVALGCSQKSV